MDIKEETIRSIIPSEGHLLTQADTSISDNARVFSELIILGNSDSMLNWKEVTVEEAKKCEKEREEKAKAEASKEAKEKRIAELEQELNKLKDEQE